MLQAVNDRAINLLLVPDGSTSDPDFEAVTREGFERRINGCYIYGPDGQLEDPSFSISLPRDPTWEWIEKTLHTIDDDHTDLRRCRECEWCTRVEDGTLIQEFRRLDSEDALRYLPTEEQFRQRPGRDHATALG